jgi:hypothetical protein
LKDPPTRDLQTGHWLTRRLAIALALAVLPDAYALLAANEDSFDIERRA